MARRLNTFVYVPDKDGVPVGFGPADDVPDWAAELITNPDVWASDDEPGPTVAELPTADPIERLAEAGATAEELEVIRSMLAALTDEERAEVGRHVAHSVARRTGEQLDEWRRLSVGSNGGDLVGAFEQLAAIQPPGQTAPPGPPPRAGAGPRAATHGRTYARANEFDVAGDAKREDIIDALEAAGIPVE
jgi:hypothetical protein